MVEKELKLKIKPVKKINNDYQTQGAIFYFEKRHQNNNKNQNKKEKKIDYKNVKKILNNKININDSNNDYKLVKAREHKIIKKNTILANTFLNSFEINKGNKKKYHHL